MLYHPDSGGGGKGERWGGECKGWVEVIGECVGEEEWVKGRGGLGKQWLWGKKWGEMKRFCIFVVWEKGREREKELD